MIGQTISHYKIVEKLGEGGMGVVYKALDTKLKRPVALKFLPLDLTRDEETKLRFVHEAQAASALDHPNIAVVHEIDETHDGRSFICMAYYEGETLKKKIEAGPLKIEEAIAIALQIAEGLQRAHEAGIVHRDIKPSNVIVTSQGHVKIVDFGLAKLAGGSSITKIGKAIGTAAYMSPEQTRGEPVDHRTDIWSFGVVLYEMVSGQLPFRGDYEQAVIYSILHEDPAPLSTVRTDVPGEVEKITRKCLQKDPARRYQTAAELRANLERVQHGMSFGETADRLATTARKRPRRKILSRISLGLAGGLFILALLSLFPSTRNTLKRLLGIGSIPFEKHLVVLPFTNVGGVSQAFCDGLVETLNSKLSQLEQFHGSLLVVPASEVRQRAPSSARDARKFFGATIAVTGSVQGGVDSVRLTMNLVDTKSLRQLRSTVDDYEMANFAVMQDRAVRTLATLLEIELRPQARRELARGNTPVSNAYIFYLQGRGYLQRYEKKENIDIAIDLFERALKEDSLYSLAFAALGEAYWRKYDATKDTQWIQPATTNCTRAIQLDHQLSPAYVTLGIIHKGSGHYKEAVADFRKALELDSVSADANRGLGGAYEALGETDNAESTYRKAIELRPNYWAGYSQLGKFYYYQGRYTDAVAQFQQVVQLTPDNFSGYYSLGAAFMSLERWSDARKMFERSIEIQPNYRAYSNLGALYFFEEATYADAARMYEKALKLDSSDYRVWGSLASTYYWMGARTKAHAKYQRAAQMAEEERKVNPQDATVLSHLADFYSMMGERDKALPLLEQSLALAPPGDVEVMVRAGETYEQLGQRDKALEWIGKVLRKGYPLAKLERDPGLKELRNDVRFHRLMKELTNEAQN